MAITKIGPPLSGIRGTLGGVVYSANGSGTYCKPWAPPSNPKTELQTIERSYLASMPALWKALTALQRTDWDDFAALPAQELTNSLGDAYYASGYNWFVKCNIRLLRVGRATRAPAPVIARPTAPTIDAFRVSLPGADVDLCVGGTGYASTQNPLLPASNAFNDDLNNAWRSLALGMPQWIAYDLPAPKVVRRYNVYLHDTTSNWNFDSWTFAAWNGTGWDTLHSVSNWGSPAIGWHTFYVANETPYSLYFWNVTGVLGPVVTEAGVRQLEMMEGLVNNTPIIYPEDEFHSVAYDIILHTAFSLSTARVVQYPGYYEILASQSPGRWFTNAQSQLAARFGLIQTDRRWFARLFRQTSEGIQSAAATTATNTLE